MNSKKFIVSSIVFLIEARKYDIAASYLLYDACRFNGSNSLMYNNSRSAIQDKLTEELKQHHENIRGQYPVRLTLEQMREIAREAYERVYQAIITGECFDSLAYSETSSI